MTTRAVTENPINTHGADVPIPEVRVEEVREELDRILSGRVFAKSPRLTMLLTYICENTLAGHYNELTEQQIGINVFGRPPGYNSGDDTIVRGTARHLRDRLALYYRDEGANDPLQIAVPKGGYMAHFHPMSAAVLASLPEISDENFSSPYDVAASSRWPLSARIAVAVCALLAVTLPFAVHLFSHPHHVAAATPTNAGPEILWRAIFTPGRMTLIVPGDAGLDSYSAWEQRRVSLADYTNQKYQREVTDSAPPSHRDVPLSDRSVTPMADLRLVSHLMQVPERMGMPQLESSMSVYYARELVVADTRDNNLVLIGSETFNPWVTLYQQQLDFNVHWDIVKDVYTVTDRAPKAGEQTVYEYGRRTPGRKAYTLVALVDNSQGQGRVLMIEGTTMGATYNALNFFTTERLWQPAISAATDKSGRLHNFEVLLSSDFIRGGVSNTQLVAVHVH